MSKYSIFFLNLPNIQGLFDQLNVVADVDAEVIIDYDKGNTMFEDRIGAMMEDSEYLFREAIDEYINKTEELKKHKNYPEIISDFRLWLNFMAHRKLSRLRKVQQITEQMIAKRKEEYQCRINAFQKSIEYHKSKRAPPPQPVERPPGYRRQKKSQKQILREQIEEYKLLTTNRAQGGVYDSEIKEYEMLLPHGPFFYEAIQRFQNKYVCFNTGHCILKEFGQNRTGKQLKKNPYYNELPNGKGITRLYYCSCQSSYRLTAITIIIQLSITKVKKNTTSEKNTDNTDNNTSNDDDKDKNSNNSHENNVNENTNDNNDEMNVNNNDDDDDDDDAAVATTTTTTRNFVRSDDTTYLCKIFARKKYCEQVQSHFQLNPDLKYGPDGIEILQQRHDQLPKRKAPQHLLDRRKKQQQQQQQQAEQQQQQENDQNGEVVHQQDDEAEQNNDTHHYSTGEDEDDYDDDNDDEDDNNVLEEDYVLEHHDEEMTGHDEFQQQHDNTNNELQYY